MPKPAKGKTLTNKEEAFCLEYVIDWNATRAAIDAGYSRKMAGSIGYENTKKPHIQARIQELIKEKVMDRDEVLARLADHARGSHYHFIRVDADGFIYFDFSDPEAQKHLHLIKKIKTKRNRLIHGKGEDAQEWEGEWIEVELHDPQRALELIGKHHNLFVERDKEGNPIQPIVNVYIPKNDRETEPNGNAG
jgi:phage terminase small subunit